jgi:glucose-6-phosphate isomerase
MNPLSFNPSGLFIPGSGVTSADWENLAPRLQEVQQEILETDERLYAAGDIPAEKQPLDHGFIRLPEQMLETYRRHREESELGEVLQIAKRMQDSVDRVVVLGIGGSYMGARALLESCCQPYFNELSRADRGGKPRMYFEGNNVDNDALQGLLHLLRPARSGAGSTASTIEDRWGLIVISKSGGTMETAVAFRLFLQALRDSAGEAALPELVVPVTGASGRLSEIARALGCSNVLPVPDGVGGRFSVLSSVGILPAAILGINVITLLEGAIAMNEHFRSEAPGSNVVLDYVGACHLAEQQGATVRILSVWAKALEAVGLWYDQLLAESLGKGEVGATPITTVNTRDLHSRQQQHQEGRRDKLVTNITVEQWRTDPLQVLSSELNQDGLNDLVGKSVPDIMAAAIQGTNEALHAVRRPTVDLRLPAVDEASIGQLLQMLMLATVVEGRLLGINPYGQPGVEDYKRNMNRLLGRK